MKKSKVEPIYDRGEELDAELIAALEAAVAGEIARYRDQPVRLTKSVVQGSVVREAAVLTPTKQADDRVLFVRPRMINSFSPNRLLGWTPLARVSHQKIGSHTFLVGRRYRAPIAASTMATLEQAYNRVDGTSLEGMAGKDGVAEPITVEHEAFVTTRSKSLVLYARWQGLWWAVSRYSADAGRKAEDVEREARSAALVRTNYKQVAII